jgi:excisionase family DNA binding protein
MTYLTVNEVAARLGRSGESIRKLVGRHPREIQRRDLDGRRYLVVFEDVERLVREVGRG